MKVHELIEKLQELPLDDELWLTYEDVIAPVLQIHHISGMAIIH